MAAYLKETYLVITEVTKVVTENVTSISIGAYLLSTTNTVLCFE